MAAPLKDGLPRKAFAYAPTADPADWKLPIYLADGSVDTDRLPGAAAALSEGGFRGQKADIPAGALANTKSKIRMAYRKWKGRNAEYPDSIKESIFRESNADGTHGVTVREATMLLDRASLPASVIFMPNGDAVVVPCYDGQFSPPVSDTQDPPTDEMATYNAQDAADLLAKLYRLKANEDDEPDQMAMLDKAIAGVLAFIKAEGDEIGQPIAAQESARALGVMLAEVGRRNSAGDMGMIQTIHDHTMKLGAICPPGAGYAEAAIDLDAKATPAAVAFLESAGEGAAVVTLAEANPIFDRGNKTVEITPIRVGWGNKRDNYFYPATALHEAVDNGLFSGIKMYRDHPRKSDEKDLPERSVKDWFATTKEARWDDARQEPRVTIKVHDDDVMTRFEEAPEQIAFSVLGNGLARPGRVDGKDGKVVESFASLKSVDWVTQAGAGGALAFAEAAAEEHDQMAHELEKLTADQLKEANPALYAQLTGMKEHDEAPATGDGDKGAEHEAPAEETPEAPAAPASEAPAAKPETPAQAPAEPAAPAESAPAGFVTKAEFDKLAARIDAKESAAAAKEAAKPVVAAVIAESTLPSKAKQVIAANFAEASWGGGSVYTDQPALEKAVRGQLAMAASLLGAPQTRVKGMGDGDEDESTPTVREAVEGRIGARWGNEAIPKARSTVFEPGEEAEPVAEAAKGSGNAVEDRIASKFN